MASLMEKAGTDQLGLDDLNQIGAGKWSKYGNKALTEQEIEAARKLAHNDGAVAKELDKDQTSRLNKDEVQKMSEAEAKQVAWEIIKPGSQAHGRPTDQLVTLAELNTMVENRSFHDKDKVLQTMDDRTLEAITILRDHYAELNTDTLPYWGYLSQEEFESWKV